MSLLFYLDTSLYPGAYFVSETLPGTYPNGYPDGYEIQILYKAKYLIYFCVKKQFCIGTADPAISYGKMKQQNDCCWTKE